MGDAMNVALGTPYEVIMTKLIERGYAGNQTEVIRQALMAYERQVDQEEVELVNKAIELDMQDIRSSKAKTYSLAEVKKKLKL
ncbi:MAG: hypothetical protein J4432_00765 [DPANN group archaeon]|nr:hypothetical protein [DPANN group archaeon]